MSWHPAVYPWLNPPPGPRAPWDQPGLRPGPRFNPWAGHAHVFATQPFPGAPAYAYEVLGLVEYSPIGPATINRNHLYPFATTAPLFATQGLPIQGIGGVIQGSFVSTPLIVDPSLMSEDLYAPGGV